MRHNESPAFFREVFFVRSRRLFPFAAVAAAALVLTGCASGTSDTASTPAASSSASSAAVALCDLPPASGAFSDAVTVSGSIDEVPTIKIEGTPSVTDLESSVAVTGDGDAIADGSYVNLALTVFDGVTGEMSESIGHGDTAMPAEQVTEAAAAQNANFQVLGCATEGSRIVAVTPAADETANPMVFVFDVLKVTPEAKWCAVVDKNGAMPKVTFADSGEPTITIPADTDAPSGVQLDVVKEGDGAVVAPGDTVTVDYTGVKWSDGSTFDTSWGKEPASFPTTGVVAGFKRALEGQKVGSTVVVTMSPACGYGEASASAGNELAGETLVFVVDIRDTATTP